MAIFPIDVEVTYEIGDDNFEVEVGVILDNDTVLPLLTSQVRVLLIEALMEALDVGADDLEHPTT